MIFVTQKNSCEKPSFSGNLEERFKYIGFLKFVTSLADSAVLQTVEFNKTQEFASKMFKIIRLVQRCVQEQISSPITESIFVSPRK